MLEINAAGLSCPTPVVKTKQAMEKNPGQSITVIVDNETAKENVMRLAASKKYSVKIEGGGAEESKLVLKPSS